MRPRNLELRDGEKQRRRVYERARRRHPERWSGGDWTAQGPVRLGKTLRETEIHLAA